MVAALLVVVLIGGLLTYLTYAMVRSEHDDRATMDRTSAERVARRDRPDGDRKVDQHQTAQEWGRPETPGPGNQDDQRTGDR